MLSWQIMTRMISGFISLQVVIPIIIIIMIVALILVTVMAIEFRRAKVIDANELIEKCIGSVKTHFR